MTVITVVATGNVGRVFSVGRSTIVAGVAGAGDLCVIDRIGRHPDVGCMAILTDFRRQDMGRVFAGRVGAIVAAGAIAGDVHVIEIRWQPADSGVTVVAAVVAVYMGRSFASRYHPIVAGTAGTYNLGVVNGESRRPQVRRVAVFTDVTCLNMRGWFAGRFNAVVTTNTVPCDVYVIEISR